MRLFRPYVVACVVAGLCVPSLATAEESVTEPTAKGITGGALLGAEAVMVTEAALKVKPAWAYVVGGLAGAAGGGVGGYFVEQGGDAELSMYMLLAGMAFTIPTTVAVLSATAYEPPANYVEDRPPEDEPVAEPAQPDSAAPAPEPTSRRRLPRRHAAPSATLAYSLPPPALLGLGDGRLSLGIPDVQVRAAYSRREVAEFGVAQRSEVRISVLHVSF